MSVIFIKVVCFKQVFEQSFVEKVFQTLLNFLLMKLGELLIKNRIVTRRQLEEAVESQVIFGGRIGTNLVELGYINISSLAVFLSLLHNVPVPPFKEIEEISKKLTEAFPKEMAKKYECVPWKKEDKTLHLIMADPTNVEAIEEISFATGLKIKPYVLPEILIYYLLERLYGVKRERRYIILTKKEREALGLRVWKRRREVERGEEDIEVEVEVEEKELLPLTLDEAEKALAKVRNREELGDVILKLAMNNFSRASLLIVIKGMIMGWCAVVDGMKKSGIKNFVEDISGTGTFNFVCETKAHFVGKPSGIPSDFFQVMGGEARNAFIIPILVRGRVVNLFYGDIEGKAVPPDISDLIIFFSRIERVYERLIKERKR